MSMQTIVDNASTTFTSTAGFSIDSVVTYAGTLVKTVIGTGLAVLQGVLPWLLVLAGIGIVLGLVRAAWRHFHV